MKTISAFLNILSLFLTISFHSCTKEGDPETQPVTKFSMDSISFEQAMKGWELYSWPNGNDWNYSILPGTNRIKSYTEVTTNRIVVMGKDSLKMLLNKMPEGEHIFWIGQKWLARCWGGDFGDLCLPDSRTISEIQAYCDQKNLALEVDD
jgi:hypothetical protein